MLEPLPQHLLAFRRQSAECRVILQRVFLLVWRQILVATQPITGMTVLRRLYLRLRTCYVRLCRWSALRRAAWSLMFLLDGANTCSLCETGEGSCQRKHQYSAGGVSRDVFPPCHWRLPSESSLARAGSLRCLTD